MGAWHTLPIEVSTEAQHLWGLLPPECTHLPQGRTQVCVVHRQAAISIPTVFSSFCQMDPSPPRPVRDQNSNNNNAQLNRDWWQYSDMRESFNPAARLGLRRAPGGTDAPRALTCGAASQSGEAHRGPGRNPSVCRATQNPPKADRIEDESNVFKTEAKGRLGGSVG